MRALATVLGLSFLKWTPWSRYVGIQLQGVRSTWGTSLSEGKPGARAGILKTKVARRASAGQTFTPPGATYVSCPALLHCASTEGRQPTLPSVAFLNWRKHTLGDHEWFMDLWRNQCRFRWNPKWNKTAVEWASKHLPQKYVALKIRSGDWLRWYWLPKKREDVMICFDHFAEVCAACARASPVLARATARGRTGRGRPGAVGVDESGPRFPPASRHAIHARVVYARGPPSSSSVPRAPVPCRWGGWGGVGTAQLGNAAACHIASRDLKARSHLSECHS